MSASAAQIEGRAAQAWRRTALHVALLLAVTAIVYFTNLGGAKLWDRDEPRNAGCAREMLQRHDWVTPYFNGELRTHKPVLTYWLMMSAYAVFGVSEFAARFWSAALGIGTTLATYVIARRLFSPAVALWSALAMATSLMFCVASRAATPDAVLIFCSTMAIMTYVIGTFRRKTHDDVHSPPQTHFPNRYFPSWPLAALMYAWMGLGILAKGPVGLIVPTAVVGMFLLLVRLPSLQKNTALQDARPAWSRWHMLLILILGVEMFFVDRAVGGMKAFAILAVAVVGYGLWRPESLSRRLIRPFAPAHFLRTCWQMRPVTALSVALAISVPWYAWAGYRTDGVWLEHFFLKHNFGRATQVFEGHAGTYLFYPISTLAGFFPWSILLIPAVVALVKNIRRRDSWLIGYLFAACWIGVYIGMFSLAKTKLPSYITPAYPALAMVLGALLVNWSLGTWKPSRWMPRLAFGALALVGVGICVALPLVARKFLPDEMWLGVVGLIPITAGIAGYAFAIRGQARWSAGCIAACASLLLTCAYGWIAPRISRYQPVDRILAGVAASSERPQLAGHMAHEPSWVFYAGQTIPVIGHRDPAEVTKFLQNPDAFVVTHEHALQRIQADLPADVRVISREKFFLKDYDLVVLGRTKEGVQLARETVPTGLR